MVWIRRLLVVALIPVVCSCGAPAPDEWPRRVVFIVVDTLRGDAPAFAGGPGPTPAMDRIAREGVVFSRARTHIPITGPAHATLFTSRTPPHHGVTNNRRILPGEAVTAAEEFAAHGFATRAVVSLGVMQATYGLAQGFGVWDDRFGDDWWLDAGVVNTRVLAQLEDRELIGRRLFLFVHYSDPHEPYAPPDRVYPTVRVTVDGIQIGEFPADGRRKHVRLPPAETPIEVQFTRGERPLGADELVTLTTCRTSPKAGVRHGPGMFPYDPERVGAFFVTQLPGTLRIRPRQRDEPVELGFALGLKRSPDQTRIAYLDEVRYVDQAIGRLWADLERHGLLDDALVVFASDHGEGLGDHGHPGHVEQLYDSLLRVPLVFWAPGRLEPEVRTDPVGLVDVLPTVLSLADLDPPADIQGRDLFAAGGASDDPLFAWTFEPQASRDLRAVVHERHKLIQGTAAGEELYDLRADPGELRDLADRRPGRADALRSHLSGMAEVNQPDAPAMTEREREMLESLGYVDRAD